MGFSKFIVFTLLATTTLVASLEPNENCSLNINSFKGPQKKFNVILKDKAAAESHFKLLKNCGKKSVKNISSIADVSKELDENVVRDFSVENVIHGYTALFDPKFVEEKLEKNEDIKFVEEDSEVSIQNRYPKNNCNRRRTTVRRNPTPNLDRIDQKKFRLDKKYEFPATAGEGVTMYIVDTGILVTHDEFEGRAEHLASTCAGCGDTDDHGHGTHVAAIAGGKTFGVANKIKLRAVKVFGASGSGSYSDLIAGLSIVLVDHKANPRQKSVVNMSLGGARSEAINAAVKALTDNGIHVAVAAGNENGNACDTSPASEKSAITVGATEDTSDERTSFSNFGNCVDIFAPGRNIKSAGIGSNNDTQIFSGTSQATPHVAGTIALIIGEFGNSSPAKMAKTLTGFATKGVIPKSSLNGSPNVFVRVPPSKKCYRYY